MNQKQLPVGNKELKKLRILVGQVKWVTTQTRADLLFDCCELASSFKNATVTDIIKANKLLKKNKERRFCGTSKVKDHLRYKTITSQNVLSEAEVKKFFIL